MKQKKRVLKINGDLTQKNYLKTLNGIFGLTPQEIEILSLLIETDPDVPCSRRARRVVKEQMRFKTSVVVSNYIKALKDKQAVIQTVDGYKFNPLLIPSKDQNAIEIIWEQSQQDSSIII